MTTWDHQQIYVGVKGAYPQEWYATSDLTGMTDNWVEVLTGLEAEGFAMVAAMAVEPRNSGQHSSAFIAFFKRPEPGPAQEAVIDQFLTE